MFEEYSLQYYMSHRPTRYSTRITKNYNFTSRETHTLHNKTFSFPRSQTKFPGRLRYSPSCAKGFAAARPMVVSGRHRAFFPFPSSRLFTFLILKRSFPFVLPMFPIMMFERFLVVMILLCGLRWACGPRIVIERNWRRFGGKAGRGVWLVQGRICFSKRYITDQRGYSIAGIRGIKLTERRAFDVDVSSSLRGAFLRL